MNSHSSTPTQFEEILASLEVDRSECYRQIIALSITRLQRLTHSILINYPNLQEWDETPVIFQAAVIKLYRNLKKVKAKSAREMFEVSSHELRNTLIELVKDSFGPQDAIENLNNPRTQHGHGDEPVSLDEWIAFHEEIEKLPSEEKEVFSLIWYAAAKHEEAATLIGEPEETVYRRFYLARLRLASS
ncbi:MAG: RNA polymerase sigma factor [Pirellulales bacterium]